MRIYANLLMISSGIYIFMIFYHIQLLFKKFESRTNILMIMVLLASVYHSVIEYLMAVTSDERIHLLVWRHNSVALSIVMISTLLFMLDFAKYRNRILEWSIIILWVAISIARLSDKFLLFYTDFTGIVANQMPWGETLYFKSGSLHPFVYFFYATIIISFYSIMILSIIKSKDIARKRILKVILLLYTTMLIYDMSQILLKLYLLRISPFSNLSMMIIFSLSINNELLQSRILQKKLAQKQELLSLINANIPIGVILLSADYKIISYNNAFVDICGNDFKATTNFNDWISQAFPNEDLRNQFISFLQKSNELHPIFKVICSQNEQKDISFTSVLLDDGRILLTVHDLTEKLKIDKEIKQAKDLLNTAITQAPIGIIIADAVDMNIIMTNKVAADIFSYSKDIKSKIKLTDFLDGYDFKNEKGNFCSFEDSSFLQMIFCGSSAKNEQLTIRDAIGNEKVLISNTSPIYDVDGRVEAVLIILSDITEKLRMEEMMIQSEKMLSVGGLAAGMAHEINNPLGGMMQTAEVLKQRLMNFDLPTNKKVAAEINLDPELFKKYIEIRKIPRMLKRMNNSGLQAAKIVTNMLDFARKSNVSILVDITKLIDEILDLAASDYDLKKKFDFRKIEIIRNYENGLPAIECEPGKIQQVLLNLLRNGAQAMWKKSDELKDGEFQPQFKISVSIENEMIKIEIEDNGPGIPENIRKRIFEPFFTTKDQFEGTGLGLSVSYFIITETHHGEMYVESKENEGSNFVIKLPLTEKER